METNKLVLQITCLWNLNRTKTSVTIKSLDPDLGVEILLGKTTEQGVMIMKLGIETSAQHLQCRFKKYFMEILAAF